MEFQEKLTLQLLALFLGIVWSAAFYLFKRLLAGIDKKLDTGAKELSRVREEQQKAADRHDRRLKEAMEEMERYVATRISSLEDRVERQAVLGREELDRQLERNGRANAMMFTTRQEFGAFTAAINHKIESIYQSLNRTTPNRKTINKGASAK